MSFQRFFQHGVILSYLTVTFSAFAYTVSRYEMPVPAPLLNFSYKLMAPFQGYDETNGDLLVEGKLPGGNWELVETDTYYRPFSQQQRIFHRRLVSFMKQGEERTKEKYTELAEKLFTLEKKKENSYEALRLTWQEWPMSIEGFSYLRHEPYVKNYPLTEVP